ncbi:hypothetical protein RHGRI_001152 [Rhododendron griersonianum]|uniref:Uncharacterized protein n=1 Tax=Rhododendron griersonianum TaxID=479676 RepID=A0AAV6LLN1_9ERIC|nr:hypothetical protein RHGRI_001152 [Rhododendron griersonianum]
MDVQKKKRGTLALYLIYNLNQLKSHGPKVLDLYQAQIQQNLIYLAAIVDAQPQHILVRHIQQPKPKTAQQQPSVLCPSVSRSTSSAPPTTPEYDTRSKHYHASSHATWKWKFKIFGRHAKRKQDLFKTGSSGSQGGNSASGLLIGERGSRL